MTVTLQRKCHSCRSVQLEDIRRIQDYTNLFKTLVTETRKRLDHVTTFALFLVTMGAMAYGNGIQAVVEAIHAKLTDLKRTFAEVCRDHLCIRNIYI